MKTIKEQIDCFVEESGCSRYQLSKEANVTEVALSKIKNGKQADVTLSTAKALYDAMRRLDPAAAEKALAEE